MCFSGTAWSEDYVVCSASLSGDWLNEYESMYNVCIWINFRFVKVVIVMVVIMCIIVVLMLSEIWIFFKRKMVLLWIEMEWIRNYRLQNYIKQIIYDTIMILSYSLMLICNGQTVNRFKLPKNLVKSTTYWTAKCSKFIKEFIFFFSFISIHQTSNWFIENFISPWFHII